MRIYYEESVMYQQEAYGMPRKYQGDLLPEWRKEQIKKVVADYYEMKKKEGK